MGLRPRAFISKHIQAIITVAHVLKRLHTRAVGACMSLLRCVVHSSAAWWCPAVLSSLYRSRQLMVRTRAKARQELLAENLSTVAGRLTCLPSRPHKPVSERLAAVLVPLFEDKQGIVRVWLTQRSKNLRSHQGEVCLPGGKQDESDPSDVHTALREAHEELGLEPSSVKVLCTLAPYLSKHLLSVTPVVAQVPSDFRPEPNPEEVGAVFSVPLHSFLQDTDHLHWDVAHGRHKYRVHSFEHQGFIIWGLTASILINVAQIALGRPAEFATHPPGVSRTLEEALGEQQQQQQQRRQFVEQRRQSMEEGAVAPDADLDDEERLSAL